MFPEFDPDMIVLTVSPTVDSIVKVLFEPDNAIRLIPAPDAVDRFKLEPLTIPAERTFSDVSGSTVPTEPLKVMLPDPADRPRLYGPLRVDPNVKMPLLVARLA